MIRLVNFIFLPSIIVAICCFQSCRSNGVTSPPDKPETTLPTLVESNLADLKCEFLNYDSVEIGHKLGPVLQTNDFIGLSIGTVDTSFHELLAVSFPYDSALKAYRLEFAYVVPLDPTAISVPLVVHYQRVDFTQAEIDTTLLPYKFPYASAEILVTSDILRYKAPFDDIDLAGSKLYFLAMGDDPLFVYDLVTAERTTLVYSGGDLVAADSIFVFCDFETKAVQRYNVLTQTVDLTLQFGLQDIIGLEVYDHHLYVQRVQRLLIYTLDLSLVDSLENHAPSSFYLTISDDILYRSCGATLSRFDLNTRTSLPSLRAPSKHISGIRIQQGKLYYCDIDRRIVASVPLSDLVLLQ